MSEGAASCWPLLRFSTPDPNMLLLQGAVSGDADLVKRALERGAFIDYRDKNYGGTALGLAALNGRLPVLDVLLQHRPGPAMGARDRVGDSALHWAALNGHPATVTLLLEHGADPTWRNSDGDLPVDMAGRGVGVTASSAEAVRTVLRRAAPADLHLAAAATATAVGASAAEPLVLYRLPDEINGGAAPAFDVGKDWRAPTLASGDSFLELDSAKLQYGDKIASGSFGDVFKGTYRGSEVAIKVLRLSVGGNEAALVREFAHELSVLRRVRHRHVVQLVGAGASPSCVLVTELMLGGSLTEHLRGACKGVPPPPPRQIKIALDVARGMDYLHQCNIVHRDLKSANLLLSEHGDVKVADFGLSRMVDGVTATMTAETGTYRWMAPEVVLHEPYDGKCDVFSFGVVLWEVASGGKVPYGKVPTLRVAIGVAKDGLRPVIPPGAHPPLTKLMPECWAHDPGARPAFSTLVAVLEVALARAGAAAAAAAGGEETRVEAAVVERGGRDEEDAVGNAGDVEMATTAGAGNGGAGGTEAEFATVSLGS